jgi:hypothetical protein
MKLCDIKEGYYYEMPDGLIFKIKETHEQETRSFILFEIDDWIGDRRTLSTYTLNNKKTLIKLSSSEIEDLSEVNDTRFGIKEYEAMVELVRRASNSSCYALPMKRNEKRTTLFNILIKYHRMTHEEC